MYWYLNLMLLLHEKLNGMEQQNIIVIRNSRKIDCFDIHIMKYCQFDETSVRRFQSCL